MIGLRLFIFVEMSNASPTRVRASIFRASCETKLSPSETPILMDFIASFLNLLRLDGQGIYYLQQDGMPGEKPKFKVLQ